MLAAGCAARRERYVPLDLPLIEPGTSDTTWASTNLERLMVRGRVPRLTWSPAVGAPTRTVASDDLGSLPAEATWAAWVCSPRRMWGSELDVLLTLDDTPTPMTVTIDLDGGVHLTRGSALPATLATRSDREAWMVEIATRHGLGGVVDGDNAWTAEELDIVSVALDLLDPRERALLGGLVLSRDHVSPRSPRELALYDPLGDAVLIHVYDGAFEANGWSFVGDLDAPVHAAVMTLVHEFGHVISDAPLGVSWQAWSDAWLAHASAARRDRWTTRDALRQARRDRRQMGHRGPVIQEYARLRPGRLTPTTWSTDVFESFAEAFALHHTDPNALRRAAPEVHAWLEAGGHLAWRDFPE